MSVALATLWMATPLIVGRDVALQWVQREGAQACIGDRELATEVSARLNAPPVGGPVRLVIDGEIAPDGPGWSASIRTTDEHGSVLGQRELHERTADCRAIDDKLVLVIALIIDPDLLDKSAEPPSPPPVRRAVPARRRWQTGASMAVLASGGMLPGLALGTAVAAHLEPPRGWPIEVAATLWPYDRAHAGSGGVKLLELTAGLALCPRLVGPLSLCAGTQAGEVRARGFGYDRNHLQHELVLDATLGLRLEWSLAHAMAVRFGADAWVPFSRPRYLVDEGSGTLIVYQPAPAAFVSEIALAMRF